GTMNLVEGYVADGRFERSGFVVDMPIEDGAATLAVRPEALDLEAVESGVAQVHRVTDYGTHGLVDLDLADGTRLKSMVSHPDLFKPGQGVALKPRAVSAYRDNALAYRS